MPPLRKDIRAQKAYPFQLHSLDSIDSPTADEYVPVGTLMTSFGISRYGRIDLRA